MTEEPTPPKLESKNPITHFEIPVNDVEKAKAFYEKTFGWKIEPFDMPADGSTGGEPYYMVYTSPVDDKFMPTEKGQINGGMMKKMHPDQPFMNYISVKSIEKALEDVKQNGGETAMPKTEIAPGKGWIAAFKDPEGTLMGLHEMPENPDYSM